MYKNFLNDLLEKVYLEDGIFIECIEFINMRYIDQVWKRSFKIRND